MALMSRSFSNSPVVVITIFQPRAWARAWTPDHLRSCSRSDESISSVMFNAANIATLAVGRDGDRSAILRITPSDADFDDGLAAALCSLRVFIRRVRSAFSRPSIGGVQVNAIHTAQKATIDSAATMTVKFFSEATRSIVSHLDRGDLVHDEHSERHAAPCGAGHHLPGRSGQQRADVLRRDQEQAAADQDQISP